MKISCKCLNEIHRKRLNKTCGHEHMCMNITLQYSSWGGGGGGGRICRTWHIGTACKQSLLPLEPCFTLDVVMQKVESLGLAFLARPP